MPTPALPSLIWHPPDLLEHWLSVPALSQGAGVDGICRAPAASGASGVSAHVFRGSSLPPQLRTGYRHPQADRLMNRKLTDVTSVGRVIVVL